MKAWLILALAAQSPNCPPDPIKLASAAAIVCTHNEAARLEPSGEPASDIATVIVSICQPQLQKAIAMINRCLGIHLRTGILDEGTRKRALREVMELRAKRSR